MLDYLKWLFNFRCKHDSIRCIHADEIIMAGWKRGACMDCPKLFDNLPETCWFTKEKHHFYT